LVGYREQRKRELEKQESLTIVPSPVLLRGGGNADDTYAGRSVGVTAGGVETHGCIGRGGKKKVYEAEKHSEHNSSVNPGTVKNLEWRR